MSADAGIVPHDPLLWGKGLKKQHSDIWLKEGVIISEHNEKWKAREHSLLQCNSLFSGLHNAMSVIELNIFSFYTFRDLSIFTLEMNQDYLQSYLQGAGETQVKACRAPTGEPAQLLFLCCVFVCFLFFLLKIAVSSDSENVRHSSRHSTLRCFWFTGV